MAGKGAVSVTEASEALRQAREFISEASGPPESGDEQERLTSTLHALENASRLAEVAGETGRLELVPGGSEEDARAAGLCAEAMRNAVLMADSVGAVPDTPDQPALVRLQHCANTLRELRRTHRKTILSSVAGGAMSADEAMTRVDTVRRLDALAHHAWRSAVHLVGRGT